MDYYKLEQIEILADKATKGNWEFLSSHASYVVAGNKRIAGIDENGDYSEIDRNNAKYIASVSPDVVKEILVEIRSLRAENDKLKSIINDRKGPTDKNGRAILIPR